LINKYDGNFKEELVKTHTIRLRKLKEKQESNELKERATKTKTTSQIKYDTTNVVKMSKIQLSQQEHIQVLSKGFKFVPTSRSINTVNNIVNCEKPSFSTPLIIKNAAIS
jgi:hypothetical protein